MRTKTSPHALFERVRKDIKKAEKFENLPPLHEEFLNASKRKGAVELAWQYWNLMSSKDIDKKECRRILLYSGNTLKKALKNVINKAKRFRSILKMADYIEAYGFPSITINKQRYTTEMLREKAREYALRDLEENKAILFDDEKSREEKIKTITHLSDMLKKQKNLSEKSNAVIEEIRAEIFNIFMSYYYKNIEYLILNDKKKPALVSLRRLLGNKRRDFLFIIRGIELNKLIELPRGGEKRLKTFVAAYNERMKDFDGIRKGIYSFNREDVNIYLHLLDELALAGDMLGINKLETYEKKNWLRQYLIAQSKEEILEDVGLRALPEEERKEPYHKMIRRVDLPFQRTFREIVLEAVGFMIKNDEKLLFTENIQELMGYFFEDKKPLVEELIMAALRNKRGNSE